MNSRTAAALNRAYEVFAHYKDPYGLARSSGVSHSLRNLTREDWILMNGEFDVEVLLFSDEAILLRHFLPRILELSIEDDKTYGLAGWIDLAFRLDAAKWHAWPAQEVEALRAVFEAWARESFTNSDAQMPIDFLNEIKENLIPYLEIWLQAQPHELAEWLWTINWKENETVWRWAIQPHVEAALEAAFFRHPDATNAQFLSRIIELIHSLRG